MSWKRRALVLLGLIFQTSSILGATTKSIKIHKDLFQHEKKQDVIVSFGTMDEMKELARKIQSTHALSTKEERIYAMYEEFHGYHSNCISEATSYLDENSYAYKNVWSSNTLIIRGADLDCAKKLAEMKDVHQINPNSVLPLIDPIERHNDIEKQVSRFETAKEARRIELEGEIMDAENTPFSPFTLGLSWGLAIMYVPEAWEYGADGYYYGAKGELMTGQGVVVANIDTGVMADHQALKDNHRKYAGWADGYNISRTPVDDNGHGTHTMGTICGSHGIGVAPGAQWIACRGCMESGCKTDALLYCCNWMLCPHDQEHPAPDDYKQCSTAPDMVSNSWGGGQGDDTFERCALALRAAGIIPVWAHGNAGPRCHTANSPGDLPWVIGVGATDMNDKLADFSSRGPTKDGRLKPDLSAPGVQITSAWPNGTDSYIAISGTSMATPHIGGLVALILQRCRLDYDVVLHIMQSTAERKTLGKSDQVCGGTTTNEFPNNFYGFGRANALETIQKVVQLCQFNNYGDGGYSSAHHAPAPNYAEGGEYGNTHHVPSYEGENHHNYGNSAPGVSYNHEGYQPFVNPSPGGGVSHAVTNYGQPSSPAAPTYYGRSGGGGKSKKKPAGRSGGGGGTSYSYKKPNTYYQYPYNPSQQRQRYSHYSYSSPSQHSYPVVIPLTYRYGYYYYTG